MDVRDNFSSFGVAFGGLAGFSCQDDTADSRLYYQGMSVRTLNSPCSAYSSQSNADQYNAHPTNPLNEFRVAPLRQDVSNSVDELDLTVTPESILDKYVPCNSDKECVDDALFPILDSYLFNQSPFSGNESGIREPTLANLLNPDHHVTGLPPELANPEDSRPFDVVNALNLQQVTNDNPANSTEILDDKSSQIERRKKCRRERQRERRKNPDFLKREREHKRERRKNPAYAEREREQQRKRYQNDFVYAEGQRIFSRTYNRMKRKSSKEEASKLATVARNEYLQSVNYPEDSGDLPQTSNSAETNTDFQ